MSSRSDEFAAAAMEFHRRSSIGEYAEPEPPFHTRTQFLPGVAGPVPTALPEPLSSLLVARRSDRAFGDRPVSRETIEGLAWAGYGRTHTSGQESRTVPSAGGLYPLRMFAIVVHCADLESNIYEYDVAHGRLVEMTPEVEPPYQLHKWFLTGHIPYSRAAVIFLLAIDVRCNAPKYGERGYRFAWLEAGHVGQNLVLAAISLALPAVPVGYFDDALINAKFHLATPYEHAAYAIVIGQPR